MYFGWAVWSYPFIFVFLRVEHHSHVLKGLSLMPWVFLPTLIRYKMDLVVRGDMGKYVKERERAWAGCLAMCRAHKTLI